MAFMDQWLADIRRVKDITDALKQRVGSENIINIKRVLTYYTFWRTAKEKKMRLNILQEYMGLSQSAMSRMIVRMEGSNCGSIRRVDCDCDKRGVYIAITDCGLKRLTEDENSG